MKTVRKVVKSLVFVIAVGCITAFLGILAGLVLQPNLSVIGIKAPALVMLLIFTGVMSRGLSKALGI